MSAARGNLKMAIMSLRAKKGRSLLTMFGVVVGIVAVVTVVGLGDGIKQQIVQQSNQYGSDLITIRPGVVQKPNGIKGLANSDLLFGLSSISGLLPADVAAVRSTPGVKNAAPLGIISGAVQATTGPTNVTLPNALVIATNSDLPSVLNQKISSGSFFAPTAEGTDVAIIGQQVANDLFEQTAPLGNTFTFRGQTFIVGGVFDSFTATPLSGTANFNDAIFIPDATAEQLTDNTLQYYTVLAKPANAKAAQTTIADIKTKLTAERHGDQNFSVLNQQQAVADSGSVLDLLTTLIGAVAAIALLVGGVGIMNIMLVSVTERMHEIGVRKAVGATNRQILGQFTLEALVLGAFGGLLGVIVSALVTFCIRTYTTYKPIYAWQAMIWATLVSIVIGVIFGAAPAVKAARKDPVDALRHE